MYRKQKRLYYYNFFILRHNSKIPARPDGVANVCLFLHYIHSPLTSYDRGAPNASGIRSIVNRCWEIYMIGTPGIYRIKRRMFIVSCKAGKKGHVREWISDSVNKIASAEDKILKCLSEWSIGYFFSSPIQTIKSRFEGGDNGNICRC